MSTGTVLDAPGGVPAEDRAGAAGAGSTAAAAPELPGLARVRRIGLVVLAVQLAGLLVWSAVLADRYALSFDFAAYHQVWWLLGRGNLDPFDTSTGFPLWAGQAEFLLWPLALLGDVWPHAVTQLWVQDAATVGAEAVVFLWLCDIAGTLRVPRVRTAPPAALPAVVAATGLVLLVADPWVYWTVSFDFHMEPLGALFVVLAGRTLYRDPASRRVWLWVVLALACGDVVATFVVALGLSAALAGRPWRRIGFRVAAAGAAWSLVIVAVGANKAAGLVGGYGYLASASGANRAAGLGLGQLATGALGHPGRVAGVLWSRWLDVYASLAAGGLIGVLSPWVVVTAVLTLLENGLNRYLGFLAPNFQEILLFLLLSLGTVDVLVRLARRRPRWAAAAAAVVAVNALAWSAVWLPTTADRWLRVSPAAAAALSTVQHQVSTADEVMVSQGVAGRFSQRTWVYPITAPGALPVHTATVWVVVAPDQGVETASVPVSDALVAELAGPLHASLVVHRAGVWAFRWSPPPGTRSLVVPAAVPTVAAWTATGTAGAAATSGPSAEWRAVATGRAGYVVSGDYWRERPGRYRATVELSTTVPVHVEVWDATGDVLLARRDVPPTNGFRAVTVPVDATHTFPEHSYAGVGPFRILPVPAAPGDRLELRVWTPGGGIVSVSALELVPAAA